MAVESSEAEDALEGPSFTIGPPSEPVPQSALEDRYRGLEQGVSYDEVDYESKDVLSFT